ncbi:MAG: efflux RND transporter periplasmic adaptor subunit, partial [Janthinobacterium lividum]
MAQNYTDPPAAGEHDVQATPSAQQPAGRGAYITAAAAFLLLAALGVAFLLPKLHHRDSLVDQVRVNAGPPPVVVTKVMLGQLSSKLELPGTVQAFQQTPIFARTSGYVTKRFVDIGDHVRAGQLLALIEDPQTRQSLNQAQATLLQLKAQLVQTQANAKLSTLNNTRNQQLQQEGVISQAAADQFTAQAGVNDATVNAAQANIAAGEANVRSLQEQASFSRVTAPFNGVILARSIDTGSLISAGSLNSVTQLFTIGQADTVRVFTNVPQANAPAVIGANTAQVQFRELPGKVFTGKVTRNAAAIDPTSRTLLAEIDLPNADGKILPGMFATVIFATNNATPPVLIPANALFVRSAGPQTFVVDANNVVHMHNLILGRDFGSNTEVISGLRQNDLVVLSPSDAITDGTKVEPE